MVMTLDGSRGQVPELMVWPGDVPPAREARRRRRGDARFAAGLSFSCLLAAGGSAWLVLQPPQSVLEIANAVAGGVEAALVSSAPVQKPSQATAAAGMRRLSDSGAKENAHRAVLAVRGREQAVYLVRSVMVALSASLRSGDFSALRALGTPSFAARGDDVRLSNVFSRLRKGGIDLTTALVREPQFQDVRYSAERGHLLLRGRVDAGDRPVMFDLRFVRQKGVWRLQAMGVVRGRGRQRT